MINTACKPNKRGGWLAIVCPTAAYICKFIRGSGKASDGNDRWDSIPRIGSWAGCWANLLLASTALYGHTGIMLVGKYSALGTRGKQSFQI